MAVDKNLFAYELAVVAIMKGEGPYVKEWLDYHLLAGVEHFYIYDNDSPDDLKKVLQPYVERGVVTYIFYPGKCRQLDAYADAVHRFKFFCRYMAWIDADEFIFPQSDRSVIEVVNEIFSANPHASGLAVNILNFGSNFQDIADYSRGVLERFTRRAPKDWTPPFPNTNVPGGNAHVSTIANPRKVRFFHQPHSPQYFDGAFAVNEKGTVAPGGTTNFPPVFDKIAMNHYSIKSREEYAMKVQRGNADHFDNHYKMSAFEEHDRNEEFDDGILRYRNSRRSALIPTGEDTVLEALAQRGQIDYQRLSNALVQNLYPSTLRNVPRELLQGKMETFLTCRALAAFLRENLFDKDFANSLEETALRAVLKTFSTSLTLADLRLLFDEMPEILTLEYPVVKEIRETCVQVLPQMMNIFREKNIWHEFRELEIFMNMLKAFDFYEHD